MNFLVKTNTFYSNWLCDEDILNQNIRGVKFVYSKKRNEVQVGYTEQFDLYVFLQSDKIIFSYGDKFSNQIEEIKKQVKCVMNIDDLKQILTNIFGDCLGHNIKYVLNKIPNKILTSRPLVNTEYSYYHDFFIKANSNCKNTGWLKEYFEEMVNDNLCCGIFIKDILVSCSDLPSMPYMADEVQEIGINTLEDYKGNGYATDVCIACAKQIIINGKCPLWSTSADNLASQRLAKNVGFVKLADILTISL